MMNPSSTRNSRKYEVCHMTFTWLCNLYYPICHLSPSLFTSYKCMIIKSSAKGTPGTVPIWSIALCSYKQWPAGQHPDPSSGWQYDSIVGDWSGGQLLVCMGTHFAEDRCYEQGCLLLGIMYWLMPLYFIKYYIWDSLEQAIFSLYSSLYVSA